MVGQVGALAGTSPPEPQTVIGLILTSTVCAVDVEIEVGAGVVLALATLTPKNDVTTMLSPATVVVNAVVKISIVVSLCLCNLRTYFQ